MTTLPLAVSLRWLRPDTDAASLLTIYAPYILHGAITFEEEVPSVTDFAQRLARIASRYAFVVAEDAEGLLGYAYASPHRDRAAYRWACESSVYIATRAQGRGLGQTLMREVIHWSQLQGLVHMYAGVTQPNSASMALHQRLGFVPLATYPAIGWKQGQWYDVTWLERRLNPVGSTAPAEVSWLPQLMGLERAQQLVAGLPL